MQTLLLVLVALLWALPAAAQEHHDHHGAHDEPPPELPAEPTTEEMEDARAQLRREHGGARTGALFLELAEYQVRSRRDGLRWEGEGWYGGDLNRVVAKSEGELAVGRDVDEAEVQLLYSRAVSPYFDLQAGLRYDFAPHPTTVYGALGFEGLAPYWFHLDGALFLSERADVLARLEGTYDQHITQRLIAQPRAELELAAQDVRDHEIGAGVSEFELGLRLRYEIRRELAPYLGVSWQRKVGQTAGFARREGERVSATSFVLGLRAWF